MAATSKQTKAAEQRRISQIGDFKNRLGGIQELPSGLIVRVHNPGGLEVFLGSGQIPNSLLKIMRDAIKKGTAPDVKDFMDLESGDFDPEMITAMTTMLNMVAVKTIVEPRVYPSPAEGEEREDTKLYADEIPDDDKQFLLQWVSGGTRDLEEFRRKQQQSLDGVVASTSAVRAAQSAAGIDPR